MSNYLNKRMIAFSLNYSSYIKPGHNNNMSGKDVNIPIDFKNAILNLLVLFQSLSLNSQE